MLDVPRTLSDEREQQFQRRVTDLELQLLDAVDRLREEVGNAEMRALVTSMAFESNSALPKRANRPKIESALLTQQVYLAYGGNDETLDCLLEFAVAVTEYYDIFDDIVDGDVREGYLAQAVITLQVLMPLYVRRL